MSDLLTEAKRIVAKIHDTAKATKKLKEWIESQPEILEEVIERAANDAIREVHRMTRVNLMKIHEEAVPTIYTPAMQQRIQQSCASLYNWPLMNGKLLGDATIGEIREEASRYHAQMQGVARNWRFLDEIAKSGAPDTALVKNVFTEKKLKEIKERTAGSHPLPDPPKTKGKRKSGA